jgi:hypothetical protein
MMLSTCRLLSSGQVWKTTAGTQFLSRSESSKSINDASRKRNVVQSINMSRMVKQPSTKLRRRECANKGTQSVRVLGKSAMSWMLIGKYQPPRNRSELGTASHGMRFACVKNPQKS